MSTTEAKPPVQISYSTIEDEIKPIEVIVTPHKGARSASANIRGRRKAGKAVQAALQQLAPLLELLPIILAPTPTGEKKSTAQTADAAADLLRMLGESHALNLSRYAVALRFGISEDEITPHFLMSQHRRAAKTLRASVRAHQGATGTRVRKDSPALRRETERKIARLLRQA